MKFIKHILIIIFLLGLSNLAHTQAKKDSLKVLFVGNSYTYFSNMPHLVSLISDHTEVKLITSKSTAGGASLSDHWNGAKGLQTKEVIAKGQFDIVVLQDHSMGTINKKEEFFEYSKKFSDLIKISGAKPYFYATWAREKTPQTQEVITKTYQQAAKQNGGGVVLVGEAWKSAQKLRPAIKLYISDGSHPSDLGAFLAACAFVKSLSGDLPEKLPNRYSITDASEEEVILYRGNGIDIAFCLKVINGL